MKCFFLFLIFLGTQLRGTYGWEIDETSSVTSVQDGDTFYISGDTVRLADINSPETGNEPGYSIAKYALTNMVGGQTVYLDTDQKSGRDPYDRLIAVVYVRYNSTHYVNVNKALIVQGVAVLSDYTNNEFSPSAWTLYVRYANDTIQTIVGPMGPQGVQGPKGDPGDSAPMEYVYASMGISIVAVIIALIAITRRK
jgi:endonuclease YncB( thermonuclease family)